MPYVQFGGWLAATPSKMVTLASRATDRDNNFNLLRAMAAIGVLVSHAYPIALGPSAIEPLQTLLHTSLGGLALLTFFGISGFFVASSFEHSRGAVDFWVARALRIFPALTLVLILTILLLGPAFTTHSLTSYFANPATYSYMVRNLSLRWPQYGLPGVFEKNPYSDAINGSLWSLFFEVACYGMVAIMGGLAILQRRSRYMCFLLAYATGYLWLRHASFYHRGMVNNFFVLTLPFVIGMTFYRLRRYIPLSPWLCLGAATLILLAVADDWVEELFVAGWTYLIFFFGFTRWAPLRAYNRLGDYSYGVYIYAFPWEQIGAALFKGISPITLIAISLPPTLACAVMSWHGIEKRALWNRTAVAGLLEKRLARLKTATASMVTSMRMQARRRPNRL